MKQPCLFKGGSRGDWGGWWGLVGKGRKFFIWNGEQFRPFKHLILRILFPSPGRGGGEGEGSNKFTGKMKQPWDREGLGER
jgi:hypothetical protein